MFIDKRKKSHYQPPETLNGLKRIQHIKILGVTFTNGLSVTLHIQQLISSNAQALYALKLLRAHGLCDTAIQAVFRSVVLVRFLYASQAWWGFAGVQDRQKAQGFLRRSTRARFCSKNVPNFSDICLKAGQNLFRNVLHNPQHVLHQLIAPSFCLFPHFFP